MRQLVLIILLLTFRIVDLVAQDYFYFDKWKAKSEIEAQKVTLVMDTTNSLEGKDFNQRLGTLIVSELSKRNVNSSFIFAGQQTSMDDLTIRFVQIKSAYVKLNALGAKIPLCNRFEISQINKLPLKTNLIIRTTLAISVDKEEQGIRQASVALAEQIHASIKK